MNEFEYKLPEIKTYFDPNDSMTIIQDRVDSISRIVSRIIIKTGDEQVRQRLIELGWTPPSMKN